MRSARLSLMLMVAALAGCSTDSSGPSPSEDASVQEVGPDAQVGRPDAAPTPDVAMVTPVLTPPGACFPAMALPTVLAVPAGSDLPTTAPSGGTAVIGEGLVSPPVYGGLTKTVVDVTGQSFAQAVQFTTTAVTGNIWDKGSYINSTAALSAGDIVLVSFWARCAQSLAETAQCTAHTAFQLSASPYTTEATLDITPGPIWTQYFMPFRAAASHAAGTAQIALSLNYPNQAIEFASFSVLSYGTSITLSQLPVTRVSYDGRDAKAPWRATAAANIAKNRMANLVVHVVDAQGVAVPDAQVSVNMTRNAFGFGTAQAAHSFLPEPTVDGGTTSWDIYRGYLPKLFNVATDENALKWQALAGDWGSSFNLALGVASMDWATKHGMRARGHTLIWPSWRNSPKALKTLSAADLRTTVNQHINDVATALAGKVDHWDVVNEPFDNHEITDLIGGCSTPNCETGLDEMATWFAQTRAVDTKAKLFINDYAILEGGGGTTNHRDEYERVIQGLIARKAPLDGIGLQGHFGTALTSPDDLVTLLDRYGAYAELWVTEYDINVTDLLLAGDYTRDFLTVLYSHPAVGGFVMWGFWDGAHWVKNAPLFTQDWKLKPAGAAYYDLVFNKWWTCTGGNTDATGAYVASGHLGDYAITVTAGAQTATAVASLVKGGSEVTVQLK